MRSNKHMFFLMISMALYNILFFIKSLLRQIAELVFCGGLWFFLYFCVVNCLFQLIFVESLHKWLCEMTDGADHSINIQIVSLILKLKRVICVMCHAYQLCVDVQTEVKILMHTSHCQVLCEYIEFMAIQVVKAQEMWKFWRCVLLKNTV